MKHIVSRAFFAILICTVLSNTSVAQVMFCTKVLTTGGGVSTSGAFQLSWTIGEPATYMLQSGTFRLTEGFQQADPSFPLVTPVTLPGQGIRVFPNPASRQIQITGIPGGAAVRICTADGMIISDNTSGNPEITFDIADLPSGMYFITVSGTNNNTSKFVKL